MTDDQLKHLLRQAIPAPVELERDLWPNMLERMEASPRPGWLDWLVAAATLAGAAAFPQAIPALLYCL